MRSKPFFLFLIVIVLQACSRSNYYEHQPLTSLPSQTHTRPIEVFYEDDGPVPKDHIEYYDLRLVKRGYYNDKRMVAFLKAEARKKGLDAITGLKKWDESEETATLLDILATVSDPDDYEYATTINYSIIEGKGIRYVENIDLTQSVKTGKVYTEGQSVGEIRFLPNGRIDETAAVNDEAEKLLSAYRKFSEDRLLYEQDHWQTLHHANGLIDVRRKYRMNDWLLERVRVNYDYTRGNRIKMIRLVEHPQENPVVSRVIYRYNAHHQLVERKISGALAMKQKLHYKQGKLTEMHIHFEGKDYIVAFNYYRQEDLQRLIKRAE